MQILRDVLDWLMLSDEAAISTAVAVLSASWFVWLGPEQKDFFKHWARKRLWTIRILSMIAHGAVSLLAALGAQKLDWEPFSEVWANGLMYAAAAEGSIRANIAGLQISSASKVWSLAELTAGKLGSNLEEHCVVKMQSHLTRLSDADLATKVNELLDTAKVVDSNRAAVYEVEVGEAVRNGTANRPLLLRVGSQLALIILWKDA